MTDQQMGLQARLMSKALRKITGERYCQWVKALIPESVELIIMILFSSVCIVVSSFSVTCSC
jgi:recA bacterial DNA recombination protein